MVVVLAREGVVVTAAPGTGSTALLAWARGRPGARSVPSRPVAGLDAKHATVAGVRAAGLAVPDSLPIVTATRDPFAWWAAEWTRSRTRWSRELDDPDSWVVRTPGMAERVRQATTSSFGTWLAGQLGGRYAAGETGHLNAGHIAEADVVLRRERLERDLRALVADARIPRTNVTGRDGRPTWDADSVALVAAVHRPDLVRFGYRPPAVGAVVPT